MSNSGKAAALMLAIAVPVLAAGQAAKTPAPQPRPTAAAAAPGVPAATPAPKAQPAANSPRFVTSDNFFHPRPKSQPASSSPADAKPSPAPLATKPSNTPAVFRTIVPVASRPAVAALPAVPEAHVPQPMPQTTLVQPVLITGTSAPIRNSNAAVDYASGQLTVVADSAPLSLVLKMIAAKTGAVVDLAPELQNEPVVARLGPSPVREVLTGLLDSPRIDYIVLGTGDEPGSLERIVVRTRHTFDRVAMAAVQPPQPKEDLEDQVRLDQNGHLLSKAPEDQTVSQQQLMENWKKARTEMIKAEIKQQAEDRENEKNQPPEVPAPPQDNPPPADNPQSENPPQS